MVLDVCPPLPSPRRRSVWLWNAPRPGPARARVAHQRVDQSLFGIVQGGISTSMRAESARRTVDLEFDGYGIGGLSVGETREEMLPALAAALEHLPDDRPRYLMGVGDPASMIEAIALGVDQFDCVLQTRLGATARHSPRGPFATVERAPCRLGSADRSELWGARCARATRAASFGTC